MRASGTRGRQPRRSRSGLLYRRPLSKKGLRFRSPSTPGPHPTSIEQFVRRAAADARSVKGEAFELAAGGRDHQSLFEPGSYARVALPRVGGIGQGSRYQGIAVEGIRVESARFGVAVCTDLLHQVTDPQTVLGELNRALQPEGRLYLTSPLVVTPAAHRGPSPRANRLGINYLLEAAGFSLTDLQAVRQSTEYAIVAHKSRPSTVITLVNGR